MSPSSSSLLLLFVIILSMIIHGQSLFFKKTRNKIKNVVGGKSRSNTEGLHTEQMMLFPNIGFQGKDNKWRLNVLGWRFQPSKRTKFLGQSSSKISERLARFFADSNQIVYYNDTFQPDRLKPFMVEDRAHEEILIMIGKNHNFTTKTDSEGQFRTSFIMPNDDVQKLKKTIKNDQVITYKAIGDNEDVWEGKIHLLDWRGLSVISDIDDTIKISEVIDKIRLAANTFIHGFRVVKGMPEVYRGWKDKYNCSFHYLSAMPDQLYNVTKEFIDDQKFPDGTFHMRHFRWSSISIFNFVHSADTKMHKNYNIRYFIRNSLRTLVLVGDSGEHDPEIYGNVTREYPKRIHQIFIRAVKGEAKDDKRFFKAFKDIPREKWLVFTDPIKELPKDLNLKLPISI
ncbi:unnamed protein product [Adineta steineri]|uniref:Phosphatidate phosphatase APP1 catalytic domain-containing protein n=1 Tax=Adineta steineri TaxID=433720 RepID=A0A813X2K0_9BILA|nr:unnamed protein product [Adineta steineri]CAF1355342.1 unnamed protein product [Adineta steineri]CAF1432840.1 unnamed protein product [Adineta steineri]